MTLSNLPFDLADQVVQKAQNLQFYPVIVRSLALNLGLDQNVCIFLPVVREYLEYLGIPDVLLSPETKLFQNFES